jgi:hypothetical protein
MLDSSHKIRLMFLTRGAEKESPSIRATGYGPRDGTLGEQNLVADAEETIAFAFVSGTVAASALELTGPTPSSSPARFAMSLRHFHQLYPHPQPLTKNGVSARGVSNPCDAHRATES